MTAITLSLSNAAADFQNAGKSPWATVEADAVVGVYANRDGARAAKNGKPVKVADLTLELVGADEDQAQELANTLGTAVELVEESLPQDNGPTNSLADADAEDFAAAKATLGDMQPTVQPLPAVVNDAPKAADKPAADIRRKSEIVRPTKLVWDICDKLKAANPNAARKDYLAECEKAGIAFYTARTQYQVWKSMQK